MTRTRMLILLALGLLSSMPGYSQQKAPQGGSVDAKLLPGAGNGGSGDVFSPDLFNGTANVSIPIYSYGNEGVSLSYNTAGIKVDQPSGPVGVNWNLNAGGSIQRIMKDMPDEMNQDHNPLATPGGGTGSWGAGADEYVWGIKGRLWQYFSGVSAVHEDAERYQDEESDDFIVSVGGLSFTFNIGLNGYIYTHPFQNIKIEMLINGAVVNGSPVTALPITVSTSGEINDNNLATLNFRIRDAQGNWYYFIKGDVSRIYFGDPDPGTSALEFPYTSRWVIQKIVKSDGLEVNYEYTYNDHSADETGTYVAFSAMEQTGSAPAITETLVKVKHQLVSSARIAAIKYPNNVKASFVYTADYYRRCDCQPVDVNYPSNKGDQILREVRISSDDAVMRYVFDQAYSLAPKSGSSIPVETPLGSCYNVDGTESYRYHRLILKGIQMKNESGTKTEPYYKFGYDAQRLPPRFNGAQDYFGYYNGASVTAYGGKLNIPLHTPKYGTSSTPYGTDKTDNASYAVAGLLDTVINAYGGMTLFYYGAHSLSNVTSDAGITLPSDAYFLGASANDGVRVNSIKTIDPKYPGRYQQQSFSYSDGQRFMPGGYFDFKVNSAGDNTMFNGNYISPHQFVNGSNHGYTTIIVTSSSDAGQLSRRMMTFKNISRGSNTAYHKIGSTQYFEAPYTDKQYIKDWQIGLPLNIYEYDKDDRILSHTINSYGDVEYMNNTLGKIEHTKKFSTADGYNLDVVAQENYRSYSGLSLLSQTEVRKYISNASYTTDIVTYDYDGRNNLWHTTTQDSRGQSFRLDNVYNYNVSGPGVDYGNQTGTTLYDMTADGLELRVSMERWKLSNVNSPYNNELFDASITGYQYQSGKIWTKELNTLRSLAPVGYTSYTGMSMSSPIINAFGKVLTAYNTNSTPTGFQLASEVLEYDAKGNPVETQLMGQDAYQSMIWDAVTGSKMAEVQNAHVKDVAFTSFESTVYGTIYTGSETITNGNFTYKQLGITPAERVSGKLSYRLTNTGNASEIKTPVLTSGMEYMLTFWVKEGAPSISNANILDYNFLLEENGWSFYEVRFTAINTDIAVLTNSSTPLFLDELRLFPKGAMMNSQVYTPLYGISSSTDARGRITYYQYDAFGRNVVVKDQEGNVLSKKDYHVAQ